MNGFNQYICDHCNQPCQINSRSRKFGKGTRWQVCHSCPPKNTQLCYAISAQGKVKAIMYNIKMGDFDWQLVISYQDNETILNKLKAYGNEEIIKIPSIAQGITPKNVLDKIKLLLLFS